jgi:hypothetical protein
MNYNSNREQTLRRRIKWLTWVFIIGLFLSGATAMPLVGEVNWLVRTLEADGNSAGWAQWLVRVRDALVATQAERPFLFYGTDWLAFGHFMIALVFVGALRDPVRNKWLYDFGLMACVLVIPFALVCGGVRGIPLWWRMIDCSFGVGGFVPLWFCRQWVRELESGGQKSGNRKKHHLSPALSPNSVGGEGV